MSDAFPPLGSRGEGSGQARRNRTPNPYRATTERDFDPYPSRLTELRRRAIEQAYAAEDAMLEQDRSGGGLSADISSLRRASGSDGVSFLSPSVAPALRSWALDGLTRDTEEQDEEPTSDRSQVFGMSRVIINTPGQAQKKARRKRKSGAPIPSSSSAAPARDAGRLDLTSPNKICLRSRLEDHARSCLARTVPWDDCVWQRHLGAHSTAADLALVPVTTAQGLDVDLGQALMQIRRIRAARAVLARAGHNRQHGSSDLHAVEDEAECNIWVQVDDHLDALLASPDTFVRRFSPIRFFHNHVLHGLAGVEGDVPGLDDAREAEASRFAEWFFDLARPWTVPLSATSSTIHVLRSDPEELVLVNKVRDRLIAFFKRLVNASSIDQPARQNLILVALLQARSVFAPFFLSRDNVSIWTPYIAAFALHATPSNLLWLHLSPAGPSYALAKTKIVFHDLWTELNASLQAMIQQDSPTNRADVRERLLASRIGVHHFHTASRSCLYAPAAAQGAYAFRFDSDVLDEHAALVVRIFLSGRQPPGTWSYYMFDSSMIDGISLSFALKRQLMASASQMRFASAADSVVWEEMATSSFGATRSSSRSGWQSSESEEDMGRDTAAPYLSTSSFADPDGLDDPAMAVGMRIVGATGLERALAELGLRNGHGPSRRLEIRVRRRHLVDDSHALLERLSKANPDARQLPVSVSWIGEEAVDGGGPRREWISALVAALVPQSSERAPSELGEWLGYMDQRRAWVLGCALGLALLHDVPVRPNLPLWFYRCLLGAGELSPVQWCLSDVEQDCDADLARRMFAYTDAVGGWNAAHQNVPGPKVMQILAETRVDRLRETQEHMASALLGSHAAEAEAGIVRHLAKIREGFRWMTLGLPVYNILGPGELRAALCGWYSVADAEQDDEVPSRHGDEAQADQLLVHHLRRLTRHIGFSKGEGVGMQLQERFWSLFLDEWTAHQRATLLSFVTGAPGLSPGWHLLESAAVQTAAGPSSRVANVPAAAMTLHLVDDPAFASYVPWSSTCTSTLFLPCMATQDLGPRLEVALQNATAGFGLK